MDTNPKDDWNIENGCHGVPRGCRPQLLLFFNFFWNLSTYKTRQCFKQCLCKMSIVYIYLNLLSRNV